MADPSSGGELKLIVVFILLLSAFVLWKSCTDRIPNIHIGQATAKITECYPCMREHCFSYVFVNEYGDSCSGQFAAAYYDVIRIRHGDCIGTTISVSYDKRNCDKNFPVWP